MSLANNGNNGTVYCPDFPSDANSYSVDGDTCVGRQSRTISVSLGTPPVGPASSLKNKALSIPNNFLYHAALFFRLLLSSTSYTLAGILYPAIP